MKDATKLPTIFLCIAINLMWMGKWVDLFMVVGLAYRVLRKFICVRKQNIYISFTKMLEMM